MDPRMRGDDSLALNLVCHSLLADFFTRSKAGIHVSPKHPSTMYVSWGPAFAVTALRLAYEQCKSFNGRILVDFAVCRNGR